MVDALTTRALLRTNQITNSQVDHVVEAYLAGPTRDIYLIDDRIVLDMAATIEENQLVRETLNDSRASDDLKRQVIRSAILEACPLRG